jgi:cytidine deaminase
MEIMNIMLTDDVRKKLIETAVGVRRWAYAPYSKYLVGAALLTASGKIYDGVNVENAVYSAGICAERTAVFKAVSEGEREFAAIAVATSNGGTPCGECRQVLSEFGLEIVVLMVAENGEVVSEKTLAELLPAAFGPQDLAAQGQ